MVVRGMEIKPMAGQKTSRVDTSALKLQIEKKFGHERSKKYLNLLTRYLSRYINKSEFDKLCVNLIGRENVRLHNLLIQAIVKNASVAKSPPPKEREKEAEVTLAFPQSLRKRRTQHTRDPKFKDRPSPLGLNGSKATIIVCEVQKQQSISLEDGEEVEQASGSSSIYSRSPVTAPIGISINGKEPRKVLRNGSTFSSPTDFCLSNGELPDTNSLKIRLEKKLEIEGLKISTDCVGLLNSSLDAYLKKLIEPCVQLASSRAGDERHKQVVSGLNGFSPVRYVRKPSGPVAASLLDFRVVMETSPSRLGLDWPEKFEKVCLRVSDQE